MMSGVKSLLHITWHRLEAPFPSSDLKQLNGARPIFRQAAALDRRVEGAEIPMQLEPAQVASFLKGRPDAPRDSKSAVARCGRWAPFKAAMTY